MSHFTRKNGELRAELVKLTDIAGRFGTPCYVYSKAALSDNFMAYEHALAAIPHLVCYAVKANSNLGVLNVLARLGAGFDIVSGGELLRVLRAGGKAEKTVFSGVGKSSDEIEYALTEGILCFNVESTPELDRIEAIAKKLGVRAPISLRVNPDVDAQTHPYISTGMKENKFGISIDAALAAYQRADASDHLIVKGVDCHIGSQLTELSPFIDALDRALALIDQLAGMGMAVKHLDLGGGLGVRYRNETPPAIADYIAAIRERLEDRDLTLILEPGRSICANAGVLLTRVEYIKQNGDKKFAVVDAAMNDMIRPALYDAWLNIEVAHSTSAVPDIYDVVGPICETGDFLGRARELAITSGNLLCIHGAGAYGFTMSSNYNSRPRAAEIMVDRENVHVVRQRETLDDLIRAEHTLPLNQ